jgi:hypothetical protein
MTTSTADFSIEELRLMVRGMDATNCTSREDFLTLQFLLYETEKVLADKFKNSILSVEEKMRFEELEEQLKLCKNYLKTKLEDFDRDLKNEK